MGYFFLGPNKFKSTSQSAWCKKHLHEINWSKGYEKYNELEKILKKIKAPEGNQKPEILLEKLDTKATDLGLRMPKFSQFGFQRWRI